MSTLVVPDWVSFLVRAGQCAPSADNSQPWRFMWDGHVLSVAVDDERGKAGLGSTHPANRMAMGAVIENLAQAAMALGLPTEALRVSPDNEGPLAQISRESPTATPVEISNLALDQRHTNRGRFKTIPLEPEMLTRLSAMTEGPARTLIIAEPEGRKKLTALVRDASEVRFQTEDIHRWLAQSLRFTPEEVARGEGLDVATLLLPPGAIGLLKLSLDWRRMAMLNRFGAFKLFAILEAAMLRYCGAFIAVLGPPEEPGVEVAAGRLMERLWIDLNARGCAVHPYYVLSDQLYRLRAGLVAAPFQVQVATITAHTAELLQSKDETIFMLLRVGIPKIADPVRSRRLPVESVLTLTN